MASSGVVLAWLVNKMVPKLGDLALAQFLKQDRVKELVADLDHAVTEWSTEVCRQYPSFVAEPLFVSAVGPAGWSAPSPPAETIWECFRAGRLPEQADWLTLVWERWREVRDRYGDGAEEFFRVALEVADPYLSDLAKRLDRACSRNPSLFQTASVAFQRLITERLLSLLPLAESLRRRLEIARALCQGSNRACRTPHLLLELLNARDRTAHSCFQQVDAAFADEIIPSLEAYIKTPRDDPFVAVDWDERDDIRSARKIAAARGSEKATPKHFLLAMLQGDSATIGGICSRLGEEKFQRLLAAVESTPEEWELDHPPTPGAGEIFEPF
jgi:hypothetical protein